MWRAQALVSDVKARVSEATGIPVPQQRLIFRGRVLRDANRITEHSVEDGACLHLVMAPQPQEPAQAQAQPQAPAMHLPPGGIPNIGAVRRDHHLPWLGLQAHACRAALLEFGVARADKLCAPPQMIGTVLGSLGLQGAINVQTTVHEGAPSRSSALAAHRHRARSGTALAELRIAKLCKREQGVTRRAPRARALTAPRAPRGSRRPAGAAAAPAGERDAHAGRAGAAAAV